MGRTALGKLLLFVFGLSLAVSADAGEYVVLAPEVFVRQKGEKPVNEERTFSTANPQEVYLLRLRNGVGGDRVKNATRIYLNGEIIVSTKDIQKSGDLIEKTITLSTDNTLKVNISGLYGRGLSIEIVGIDEVQPNIVATVTPEPNEAGWYSSAPTVSFSCLDTLSGIQSCSDPVVVSSSGAGQVIRGEAVDNAGNSASTFVELNVDLVAPTIESSTDPLANSRGWHHSSVTVDFLCGDDISGVADCSAPVTIASEGLGQTVPGSVQDVAGNSASVEQTLNIDLTAPEILASLSAPANAAGWHNNDVTVQYACDDALSGVENCPQPATMAEEGAGLELTASVQDLADNSASVTVNLNLDKTPPTVTPLVQPAANAAGWHNASVDIDFECVDALSGVADCSAPVTIASEGQGQIIPGNVQDVAGNTAEVEQILNIDLTAPQILATLSTPANAAGWHNADLSISFACDDALSGIVSCPQLADIVEEGQGLDVTASVKDLADNSASVTVNLNLDKTPPTVTPVVQPAANTAGWHNAPVTISFECTDALSGMAECSAPVTVDSESADHLVPGEGRDLADNVTAVTQALKLDLTPPVITANYSATPNDAGWYSDPLTITFSCTDSLSGIDACPEPVVLDSNVSGFEVRVTATDLAGNSAEFLQSFNVDSTPPQIAFTAPAAGVELNALRPQVQLSLSDNLALNSDSLALSVNVTEFPGSCTFDADTGIATCDPQSDFSRGPVQLEASVSDLAGNTSLATLSFHILEDRDGDNVPDIEDLFPDDPTEWADLDGDGIGDNSDPDRDGDGITNDYETQAGTDPNDASSTPPDLDGDGIPNSLDDDIDGDGFSNEEELAAGTNPEDPADIPRSLYVAVVGQPFVTKGQFIDLHGPTRGENLARLFLTSDQYAGAEFAATLAGLDGDLNNDGSWQARIPLVLGQNAIVATIENGEGEQASASFTVLREEQPPVIELVIDTPADNTLLTDPRVVITGRIISEQAVSLPAVQVNGSAAEVSQGASPTEFVFRSSTLNLAEGANQITASSVVSGQALSQQLTLIYQPETEQLPPPVISLRSPQSGVTLNEDTFTLLADVSAEAGLAEVTVNGETVNTSAGNIVQKSLSFPAGDAQLAVVIEARDNLQQVSSFTAEYYRDTTAPVIAVNALQPFPVENILTENPYTVTGTVSDTALSQFQLNGKVVALEPTASVGEYSFVMPVSVAPGPATSLVLEAVDTAGNRTSVEYLLASGSDIQLEWLTPDEGSQILLESSGQVLNIAARLSSTLGVASVQLEVLSNGQPLGAREPMQVASGIASAQLTLPETPGAYTLRMLALDSANALLASSSRAINLQLVEEIPLQVIKATPVDEAADVEPNGFVAVFFNQQVELGKLQLTLHETANGFTYVDADPAGTDSLQAQGYVLQQVNRNHEAVPGVLSLLPNDTTALFYPRRDLAYNADLYLSVTYDGDELLRRHFRTRPRPTFIEGVVVDNLGQPVVNAQVTLPELKRTATTNSDGAFTFGYGDAAGQTLPGGNYQLLVNADLKDRRFGSYTGSVNIEAGARNQVNSIQLPLLNQNVPFSHLASGVTSVINGGEVQLDATSAGYAFGDGREQGAVHVQFLPASSLRQPLFDPRYTPLWAYSVQPRGIAVTGALKVDFALPAFQGTYDYAPAENELVVLLGSSADGSRLQPVGVGQAVVGHRIVGVGESHWQTLDYITYARVIPEQWADLQAYRNGEIDLDTLRMRLQTYRFVPPANEAEAAQRAAELAEAQP